MNKKTVISNFFWRFAERSGAQLVTFIVSLVLARLIDPAAYGTIALMTVFISIVQVFVDSGLGNSLVQKKDADDLDFSSVFFANIITCVIFYFVLFFLAPVIAEFYDVPELKGMLRVQSLLVVISGIKNVQQAYISKHMMFKRFFFATLGGTICAAIVGIYLALIGAGAWALIIQSLVNATIDSIIVWVTVEWRPKFQFSINRLKSLYAYGWKLFASALLDTSYNKLREMVIGKVYSAADLAFYNRGQKMPDTIIVNVNSSIDSVLLPAMSEQQDNKDRVREMTQRAIQIAVYIMAPLMMGLAFAADSVIGVLLGGKWMECVPYMRIFCITYMFYPIHTANLNAIKAMGRSDIFLKMEILKKIIGIILLLATVNISVLAMTFVLLISSVSSQIINTWPNKKLLDYSYLEQIKDVLPSILLAIFMGLMVFLIGRLPLNIFIVLILQICMGAVIYICGSLILKLKPFIMILDLLKEMRGKKDA